MIQEKVLITFIYWYFLMKPSNFDCNDVAYKLTWEYMHVYM